MVQSENSSGAEIGMASDGKDLRSELPANPPTEVPAAPPTVAAPAIGSPTPPIVAPAGSPVAVATAGTPPTVENLLKGMTVTQEMAMQGAYGLLAVGGILAVVAIGILVCKLNELTGSNDRLATECLSTLADRGTVGADGALACILGPRLGRSLPFVLAAMVPLAIAVALVRAGLKSLHTAQRLGAVLQIGVLSDSLPRAAAYYLLLGHTFGEPAKQSPGLGEQLRPMMNKADTKSATDQE